MTLHRNSIDILSIVGMKEAPMIKTLRAIGARTALLASIAALSAPGAYARDRELRDRLDLRRAAGRLDGGDEERYDLLSERQHLVPAGLRRQRRALHGGGNAMTVRSAVPPGFRWFPGWRSAAALLLAAVPMLAPAQGGVDPEADRLLKASLAQVGQFQAFGLSARTSLDVVLKSGQKIQLGTTLDAVVQRPNRLRVRRGIGADEVRMYYDGRSLTLWSPARQEYVALPAPDTLDKAIDFAREKLGIVAPAGDLMAADAYPLMMDGVTSGFVVGTSVVEGVRCHHLAFRAPDVDWQIWIEQGARPLPRKLVITTRDQPSEPQFELVITQWNLQPKIGPGTFKFVAPQGAQKVELPSPEAATPGK